MKIRNEVTCELLPPLHPLCHGAWTWVVNAFDLGRGCRKTRKYKHKKNARRAATKLRKRGRFIEVTT